jgi:SAM-dependent methyltransferase
MAGHFGGNPYSWNTPPDANTPHISRYFSARGWVMPYETVIDAACCNGYGSHLIAQFAKKVIGLDVDEGCIESAKKDWVADNLEFQVNDLGKDELPDADVIISIETMEHINGMEHFLDQVTKHISRLAVICVPMGGTSYDYSPEEQALPRGENNDFMTDAYVIELFVSRGWQLQWHNTIGYSTMFTFFKHAPERPL